MRKDQTHKSNFVDEQRIVETLQDKTSVIDEETADLIVDKIHQLLGPHIIGISKSFGVDTKALVRSRPLFHACRIALEKKGLTIKAAAGLLEVPQYRLKAIEGEGDSSSIKMDILERYVEFLDLQGWFKKWKKTNGDIYVQWKKNK